MRNWLLLMLVLSLGGCSFLARLGAHKMDIQQGNYLTQDMVAKLKPGMTRNQVKFALGTPLVADPFHSDRWDYVYVLRKQGRIVEERRVQILFKDDKLDRIEGAEAVPEGESTAAASPSPPARR